MLKRRTDLALEAAQLWQESAGEAGTLPGVESEESTREGYPVTTVRSRDEAGARALGKPVGTYVTLELDGLARREEDAFGRAARALAAELGALLGLEPGAPALVVGLGNRAITPDNIGPKAADQTMVTRHLVERVPEHFGSFRPVAPLAAALLGTTDMDSADQLRTIQLSDTGITPGSGVGNARAALNAETLGVPVIAVGVPTVVDAATLTCDVLAEAGKGELNPAALQGAGNGLIVPPKDIDTQVHDLAKVIGYGINLALHTGLTIEDVELFLS